MKQYIILKPNGEFVICDFPIVEDGVKGIEIDITSEQLKKIQNHELKIEVQSGQVSFKENIEKIQEKQQNLLAKQQEAIEVENLRSKLEKGEATLEEIQKAIAKLL